MARSGIGGSAPEVRGYRRLTAADPNTAIQVTIVLRDSNPQLADDLLSGRYDPAKHGPPGADAKTVQEVEDFVRSHGLAIVESNPRNVVIRGSAAQMRDVFGAELDWFESPSGERFLSYEGELSLPAEIAPDVIAVLGLDQRPIAKRR